MEKNMRELLERNNFVVYEYNDDERSNVNERYISYDGKLNVYVVEVAGEKRVAGTLVEARGLREEMLRDIRTQIIER